MIEEIIDGKTYYSFLNVYVNKEGYMMVLHRPHGEPVKWFVENDERDMDKLFSDLYDLLSGKTGAPDEDSEDD